MPEPGGGRSVGVVDGDGETLGLGGEAGPAQLRRDVLPRDLCLSYSATATPETWEFTRDGRYALASLWEDDGALIVYDAATLREVKRLPMRKPVGKYNIGNKLAREEGTSH